MARSPLTLAAAVSAAIPDAAAVTTAALSTGDGGRFDSALVGLDTGDRVVVRVPTDDQASADQLAEALALRALSPGARELLPFAVPHVRGEAQLPGARCMVMDFLPGYRVEAGDVPPGPGTAVELGAAIAAIHSLPVSVVRAEGLPMRTPEQVRRSVSLLIDRAGATRRLPVTLATRWRRAVEDDELWRFESCVVLGDAGGGSFLFEDIDGAPRVTGVLGWHRFGVGDPATDLHWVAAAPQAADDIHAAYAAASERPPDGNLRTRARLYAELEFAQWLLHGHDEQRDDIVDDAVALLEALVDGLGPGARLDSADVSGVEDAMAVLDETPRVDSEGDTAGPSTSLQTDTYDPQMMSLFIAKEREHAAAAADDEADDSGAPSGQAGAADDPRPGEHAERESAQDESAETTDDEAREAQRASRAAFQRWASSSSE
ncbi:phosphotransferase [Microbacterium sp. LRZ72]|uniref:phosphotransferase n=1 Tax=Microbacterium sp. LRZ72 TaxID=2942481 RepID=UPI0029BD150D|nr:phosphotransferase [Microbacterium sp. LRZ72]MDX2375738.1 phosphotransferase [Microbacterium sp. LRZ72]